MQRLMLGTTAAFARDIAHAAVVGDRNSRVARQLRLGEAGSSSVAAPSPSGPSAEMSSRWACRGAAWL